MASEENKQNRNESENESPSPKFTLGRIVTVRSLVAIFLWTVVVILALRYFPAVKFAVLGFLAAATLAATFEPVVSCLPGPRSIKAVGSMLLLVALVTGLLGLIGWRLHDPVATVVSDWEDIRQQANDVLLDISDRLDMDQDLTLDRAISMGASILTGGSGTSLIGYAADAVFGIVLGVVVVLIATMYLLSSRPGALSDPAVEILPPHRRDLMKRALTHIEPQLRWWVIGTSFSMVVVGVTSLVGYWIVGVNFAVPLGVFAGLTQVVPTFGPMVAFALSMTIAATQGIWVFVGVVAVYVIVQTLESYILTPMVMLKAVHIPPVITLFTVIFWGNLFGVAGLILAIPIDMTIWAMIKYQVILYRKDHNPNGQMDSEGNSQPLAY